MSDSDGVGSGGGSAGQNPLVVMALVWYAVLAVLGVVLSSVGPAMIERWWLVVVVASVAPIGLLSAYRTGAAAGSRTIERKIDRMTQAVVSAQREGGLSEGAKRVLHRREERDLLRRAIEQDIQAQDYDAAMVLVKELAERFGYRVDAEEFRGRIERARAESLDQKVVSALGTLHELIDGRRWAEAYAEAARIERLYPESHRVDGLRGRVDEARHRYRAGLERRFLVTAQRERIDEAMALLRELDQYLTPAEAERFQEVARGVIGKSRENLGVRFKLMVQDHQWSDALEVGQKIVEEFPNTRMAEEVRELMPRLRERAGGGASASV